MEFPSDEVLRQRVRDAIQSGGKSKAMAQKTGVPVGTLNKYVAMTSTPSVENAHKIARALSITIEQLVSGQLETVEKERSTSKEVANKGNETEAVRDESEARPKSKESHIETIVVERLDTVISQLSQLTLEMHEKAKDQAAISVAPPRTITYLPFRASAGGGSVVLDDSPGLELDIDDLSSQILGLRRKNIRLIEIIGDSMLPTFVSGDVVVVDRSYPRRDHLPDTGEIYLISKDGELLVKRARWADDGVLEWTSDNPSFTPIRVWGEDLNNVKPVGKVVWLWRRAL